MNDLQNVIEKIKISRRQTKQSAKEISCRKKELSAIEQQYAAQLKHHMEASNQSFLDLKDGLWAVLKKKKSTPRLTPKLCVFMLQEFHQSVGVVYPPEMVVKFELFMDAAIQKMAMATETEAEVEITDKRPTHSFKGLI